MVGYVSSQRAFVFLFTKLNICTKNLDGYIYIHIYIYLRYVLGLKMLGLGTSYGVISALV